jgi:hypothetical protein
VAERDRAVSGGEWVDARAKSLQSDSPLRLYDNIGSGKNQGGSSFPNPQILACLTVCRTSQLGGIVLDCKQEDAG